MHLRWIVLGVFIVGYAFVSLSKHHRAKAVWIAVGLMFLCGQLFRSEDPEGFLSVQQLFVRAINWNIIGILTGAMLIADMFIESRVPALVADRLIARFRSAHLAMLAVCLFAGLVSSVVDNVTTVLIVSPIALAVAKQAGLPPVPLLVGIAVSANLQGAATLIGDPPSMLLASSLRMTFNDFFLYKGKPSMFFAIQLGALASAPVLYLLFRRHRSAVVTMELIRVHSWVPTGFVGTMIGFLVLASFLDPGFVWLAGTGVFALGLAVLVWGFVRNRSTTLELLERYDLPTLFFLAGIFVLAYTVQAFGWVRAAGQLVTNAVGNSEFAAFMAVVWFSVLISAFVDNIAYVAVVLPVAGQLAGSVGGDPFLYAGGLLIGACLGGNITPLGAACNVVAVGTLRREGHLVSFWQFARIGLPFTLAATAAGAALIWAFWH